MELTPGLLSSTASNIWAHSSEGKGIKGFLSGSRGTRRSTPAVEAYGRGVSKIVLSDMASRVRVAQ